MKMADTPEMSEDANWPRDLSARLRRVGKASMEVTIVIGRTRVPLEDVLNWEAGSVTELDHVAGQPVDIMVNDVLFGMGEVVVIGDNLGIRINHLLKPEDMVLN
jgi:flagellar motor switch protein FliN/FliY